MKRKVLEKMRLILRREMGHAVSLGIAGMLLGLAVAPALGQEQTKPVIRIVATGGNYRQYPGWPYPDSAGHRGHPEKLSGDSHAPGQREL